MLHGCYTGGGTSKIEFRVAAKPDDELHRFQTDRKLTQVASQLSTLFFFEKVVGWTFREGFSNFTCYVYTCTRIRITRIGGRIRVLGAGIRDFPLPTPRWKFLATLLQIALLATALPPMFVISHCDLVATRARAEKRSCK